MIGRRSFFATLLAPLVARLIPRNTLLDTINDGINPEWDGAFRFHTVDIVDPMEDLNAATLRYINGNALPDSIFKSSPLFDLLSRRERILDAGGSVVGQFGRMPGKPWERLSGGLRHPDRAPRLPA